MAATVSTDGRIQRRSGYAEQARSVGKKELETDQHFLLHWKAYNFTKRVGMKHQPFIEDNDSERTESMDLGTYVVQNQNCLAPGRLLWAKMDPSPWWPVQIVDERTVSQNCIFNDPIKGGVLARFYGSCIYAWVDPFAYVSHFQESFKEKGSNLRAFQKALEEEMLLRSKIVKSCVEPNGKSQYPETSSQHNKSGSELLTMKIFTRKRTKREDLKRSRSQGKQKEKALSNQQDVTTDGSEKKMRQLRVMRHLGLAAPPDSPFNANSPAKIAASKHCKFLM